MHGYHAAVITHLQGNLAVIDASVPAVEVDVSGVRYQVLVPLFLWPEVNELAEGRALDDDAPGPAIGLHIFYHATTNSPVPVLVGFFRRAERDFFRKFTTVEGIGPLKAAKAMNVSVSVIARAIEQEDRATLSRMPGVGPRAADKIIASLRGKVTAEAAMHDGAISEPVDTSRFEQTRAVEEAVAAVVSLGYPRAEARRWVEDTMKRNAELISVEDITLAVLKERGAR